MTNEISNSNLTFRHRLQPHHNFDYNWIWIWILNSVNSISEVYNNKKMALGNIIKNPVVLTPNESYEFHSLLTELTLINQLYFP
jgi:hypothetical protein